MTFKVLEFLEQYIFEIFDTNEPKLRKLDQWVKKFCFVEKFCN